LANSYHDSGRFGEAINVYKKRIELGGWQEEVWYSYYRIGLCFKNMDKMDDAIKYWTEGFDFYSQRLEGLYEIIKHYRIISKHKLANLFYQQAKQILDLKLDRNSYLFLQDDIYTSKLYYEYTIFAAYVDVKNINDEVIKVLNNSFDDNEVNNMLSNMKFYKDNLIQKDKIVIDDKIISVINNENTVLYSSSSCLIPNQNNDGYFMNVRYVNYLIDDNGSYLNCDKYIITVNKFVEIDKVFKIKTEKWMELKFDNRRYIGIEDVRIFNDIETNNLLFMGTGFHQNHKIGIVNGNYDINSGKLNEREIVPDFANSDCEKNWVFVDYNDSSHVIYNWNPLKICKMNNDKNILSLVKTNDMPKIFSRIRGSTNGFKYSKKINTNNNGNISIDIMDEEIWFVTHLVSYETPRHYYHLIVVFDTNMNLLRYSAPFKFEGDPIEYCLSIVVQYDQVLINYSTWDRTTRIGVYDKKYIDSILRF
jgi:tetratricopeptide (TPR) repeat protein